MLASSKIIIIVLSAALIGAGVYIVYSQGWLNFEEEEFSIVGTYYYTPPQSDHMMLMVFYPNDVYRYGDSPNGSYSQGSYQIFEDTNGNDMPELFFATDSQSSTWDIAEIDSLGNFIMVMVSCNGQDCYPPGFQWEMTYLSGTDFVDW